MNNNPFLDPMSRIPMFGVENLLVLAILGILLIGGFALFIYSIVAKRYWLTILMLILPLGLMIVLGLWFVGISRPTLVEEAHNTLTSSRLPKDVSDSQIPDIAWSNSLQTTADIFPSIDSCGRPLAFRVAESIRSEKRSQKKFAVAFAREKRPGDRDQWRPPNGFVVAFRNEFMKQFPGSTVREPSKSSQPKTKAESPSDGRQPLEIKLSLTPPKNKGTQQAAGAIAARWTKPDGTRAVKSTDFVNKPWVFNPDDYIAKNYTKQLVVGFSQRLGRSPAEATAMALDNASRTGPNAPSKVTSNQIVDRFLQKLTLPYGELWQESILVDKNVPPTNAGFAALPAHSTHAAEATRLVHDELSVGFTPTNGLILTTIGLIAIGWISNLLTQGYYRQNISYTVGTGVVVLLGLLGLVFIMAQFY